VIVGLFLEETCVTGLPPTRRDEDVEEEVGGGEIGPGREDVDAEMISELPGGTV
jgi:hypothetical protein